MLFNTKNPHGGDIYGGDIRLDFSANTNPFGTPPAVQAAIRDALPELHRYPDPYCRKLVKAIGEFEGLPEKFILCGSGAAELIYGYAQALSPRKALELAPTFSEYALSLERVGCRVSRCYLRQEDDFEAGDALLDAIRREEPEVVYLCNPNNPTGKLLPETLLETVIKECKNRNIRIFLDECFLDLTENGISMKKLLEDFPNLFILKAFTKSYGMAGVRLGYGLCSDAALLQEMARSVQPWNVSSLAQAAGVAALGQREFLRHTVETVAIQRSWLQAQLEALGLWVCRSQTNFLLFRGPVGLHDGLRRRGIAIRNCDNYPGLGPGWYRIAVRLAEENEILIKEISKFLQTE